MEGVKCACCEAVGGELDSTIGYIKEFGAEIAFPEGLVHI